MRYTVILTTVLLVALAGCTAQSQAEPEPAPEQTQQPSNTTNDSQDQETGSNGTTVVTYTADGFQPQQVTVQQGDTVVWQKQPDAPAMDVAVDQHPTHTEWDGTGRSEHCADGPSDDVFDSCGPQQEYSFTFTKKGEWAYHNHAAAYHTGTVVVE